MKITSKPDYYGIIFTIWPNIKPFQTKLEFDNKVYEIKLKKSDNFFHNFEKNEAPKYTYDCYAELMSKKNSTQCPKNCISTRGVQVLKSKKNIFIFFKTPPLLGKQSKHFFMYYLEFNACTYRDIYL